MNESHGRSIIEQFDNPSCDECITPTCDELNYETSQISCPHKNKHPTDEKCQKLFKNIMALNVHLQMYHKESGIITASNRYLTRTGKYHCPVSDCLFFCRCVNDYHQALSFSNFNAVRLHYLRQHGLKKEQCSKCSKSFGLHQDFIAHEKICGINCPFACTMCDQQFQNRTSLRRHQLKMHTVENQSESPNGKIQTKNSINSNERQQQTKQRSRHRRRPVPSNQVELARQAISSAIHSPVTVNPMALELLKTFRSEPTSKDSSTDTMVSDSDKATQTYTRVSVGTECCSITDADFNRIRLGSIRSTEQKSSQTQSRIRTYRNYNENYSNKMTSSTSTDDLQFIRSNQSAINVYNASTMTQWESVAVTDTQTERSSSFQNEIPTENLVVSNILQNSQENNNSVIVQTLPISMTSTQMQTIGDDFFENSSISFNLGPMAPFQESVGTSCVLDEFLFDEFARHDQQNASVLFDLDAMDLLDLIDSGTQTNPLNRSHETQTINEWDSMVINGDEWI